MNVIGYLRAIATALALLLCCPAFAQNAPDAPPDDPTAVVERALKMIFDGWPAAALELLRPLADRYPEDTDAHFFRGMAAAAANLPEGRHGAPENGEARRALRDEAADRILGRGPPAPSRAAESGKEALGLLGQRAANVCQLGSIGHSRRRESLSVMSVASRVLDREGKGKARPRSVRDPGRYLTI